MKNLMKTTRKVVAFDSQFKKQNNLLSFAVASVLSTSILFNANAVNAAEAPLKWADGRILVKAVPGLSEQKLANILEKNGGKVVGKLQQIGLNIVQVPGQAEEKVAFALSHNPNIQFAELDMLLPLAATTPNDPKFSGQWHLSKINGPLAWDVTMGSGVTVAVLDSGVDSDHPDLATKLLPGFNAVDGGVDSEDLNGHGTAVAGTFGAIANNGTGVASVAWDVDILPVRVSNSTDGWAYFSDIARGLTWAADNGAKVVNISYGVSNSSSVSNAAKYLKGKGGLVVVSAGNGGTDLAISDNPDIISVSASDKSDVITSWSDHGNFIDVIAPGYYITTTNRGGGYGTWNGTSFSSPVVAGAVALIMSANPSLTPEEVENILETTALDLGTAGWDKKYGHGRVDVAAAVNMAINTQVVVDNVAPSVQIGLIDGETVTGEVLVDVAASDDNVVSRVELYVNGKLHATDSSAPFQFSWDTTAVLNGSNLLEARAIDGSGNVSIHQISVNVSNVVIVDVEAPTVSILSHLDGDIVSGNVKISISASDNINVTKLSCYVDGNLIAATNDLELMTCTWNTRKASKGVHSVSAKAEDAAGNVATVSVSLTVGSATADSTSGPGKGKKK